MFLFVVLRGECLYFIGSFFVVGFDEFSLVFCEKLVVVCFELSVCIVFDDLIVCDDYVFEVLI